MYLFWKYAFLKLHQLPQLLWAPPYSEVLGSADNGVCEMLAVHIHQLNTVVAYRPPDTRLAEFTPILATIDNILSELPDPTPNIVMMGDFNFQDKNLSWIRSEDGLLVPLVHDHREVAGDGGVQVRHQASKLCELSLKHNMIQQVDLITHGKEILDLIFSNNEDLVSSVSAESWPSFSDHKLVSATVSFQLEKVQDVEESHLLESGYRLKKLNFAKAPWPEIQAELELAKESPVNAHLWFMDILLPLLENLVPKKTPRRKGRNRMERQRKLLWRKLTKIQRSIDSSASLSKISKLLQDKWELENQLKSQYASQNWNEEKKAVENMKENSKYFFSFAKSRQKTKARIGPFLDPTSGQPNPDPDYAASVLFDQYKSVFVQPRSQWKVNNVKEFFSSQGTHGSVLTDIEFTENDIENACYELKPSSAAGADGVPATLLKTCRK